MIPKTAEYALRAVVVLARDLQRAYSAEQIVEATRVPRRYAHKVLQALVRAELVRSQSGPGGGYALVCPPEELSILDVVSAIEPIPRIRQCPLGLKSHTSLCPLHRELDEACAATERAFARVTIAQLLNRAGAVPPLCELERKGQPTQCCAHRDDRSRKEKKPARRMRRCTLG
ncbi:MAG: Rrf2 family transcriptional regulator [Gemmataceae bacterium]|nr:Rrf2 family transcriptional regulator [Gemmataceae bacterium]